MIKPIAPTETMEPPASFLEKRNRLRQRLMRLHAITRIVTPARVRPARIALLAAGAKRNHVGATLRPARTLQRNVERKQDFVECAHQNPRCPRATARAIWPVR